VTVKAFRNEDPECDFSDPRFVRIRGEQHSSSLSHIRLARSKNGVYFQLKGRSALAPSSMYESYEFKDPRIVFIYGIYYIACRTVSPLGSAIVLASTTDLKSSARHGIILSPDNRNAEIYHGAASLCYVKIFIVDILNQLAVH